MLKQSLQHKLLQKLSPQQIQLMKMIQLPTQAFEERLKQEIEENPALDTGKEEPEDFEDSLENEFDDDEGVEKIDTDDINIDEYLSDDEIPSYKT
ncbi:MAG: RNA polymerase sigma-54 factor, partial [Flavobacteriaceae bacterium]|nr:RNA polymerase sigma-54 factor [Flavobacteriaceae bacterium]